MKIRTYLFLTISILFCTTTSAQTPRDKLSNLSDAQFDTLSSQNSDQLQGAWTTAYTNDLGNPVTVHTIVTDGYIAETFYDERTKRFDRAIGGSWTIIGNTFYYTFEFSSADSTQVGQTHDVDFVLKGDTVTFAGDEKFWIRVDHGNTNALTGAWLITGRKRNGEMTHRKPGTRKTMKILSDSRFQWIAYDTSNGKFRGTGGGTYTAKNGKYVENIQFFSRNSDRVGASLSFDFEVKDGEWHHSGLSSKGDPIYEIWTQRKDIVE